MNDLIAGLIIGFLAGYATEKACKDKILKAIVCKIEKLLRK